jgi:hypothetical protein
VQAIDDDPPPLIVIMSHGGQGRDVLDACMAAGVCPAGVLDDSKAGDHHGIPIVGLPDEGWHEHLAFARFIVAMSDGARRLAIGRAIIEAGGRVEGIVHPGAYV